MNRTATNRNRLSATSILPLICVLLVLASLASTTYAQERTREFRYAIVHISGIGGDNNTAHGINDHGHVVGELYTPDRTETHAFYWNGQHTRDLGTLGGNLGAAYDINNAGWVVGGSRDFPRNRNHAFLWKGEGELIPLPELLGATSSFARAINDSNLIAGSSDTPEATRGHAVLWKDENTVLDLGTLGGPELDSSAYDIDEKGFITGWSGMNMGGSNAFLWDGEEMIYLGSLGGGLQRGEPQAMNDSGSIVGWGDVDSHNRRRPFLYSHGRWRNILRPITDKGFDLGTSWDINNANQLVGEIHHEDLNDFFAFIAQPGDGIQILNDLIPPNCDYDIKSARAINEHSQIAANGLFRSNPTGSQMFLLTPIDPEMTLEFPDGPLRADAINTFTITNAQPGATIKFFYGKKGGGKRIPGCDALEAMTQIDDPVAFGEAIADTDGHAELEIYIPPRGAVHWGFLIQAVDFQNCEESQLVLKKVE